MNFLLIFILTFNMLIMIISSKDVYERLHTYFMKPLFFSKPKIEYKMHSCCEMTTGGRGICVPITKCPRLISLYRKGTVKPFDKQCGWQNRNIPLLCCLSGTRDSSIDGNSIYNMCRPEPDFKECGSQFDYKDDLKLIYSMNETAEQYKKKGFTVVPVEVDVDKLVSFKVSNETHKILPQIQEFFPGVGGRDAPRRLTSYLALIGKGGRPVSWLCGGVIINRNWVLSAAHCFMEKNKRDVEVLKKENIIVRLGEYDFGSDDITSDEFPMDYGIKDLILHPDYEYVPAYHDLALLQLNKSIPYHRPDMRPVCLPWENEVNRNLVGMQVTLTGWGSVKSGGKLSPKPQEVNVTVLDTSICEVNYSALDDFDVKYSSGIHSDTLLCAGSNEGGKDACMGDSGGPIVYQDRYGKYTLAGIVSSGYGCGLREYPGIYTPINKPPYLSWIKKIAFDE